MNGKFLIQEHVWLIMMTATVITGCMSVNMESRPSVEMEQDMTSKSTAVTLHARAEIRDNRLIIQYEVFNGLDKAIFLTNRIFQWTPEGMSLDPNLVYSDVVDDMLRLVKACLPVPEELDVESPIVPYLTELPSGESLAETISISLPLMPYHPYDQLKISNEAATFSSIQFVVGWFPSGTAPVRSQQRPDGMTLLSADYGDVIQVQEILQQTLLVSVPAYIEIKR
jgi:hypothetical protein